VKEIPWTGDHVWGVGVETVSDHVVSVLTVPERASFATPTICAFAVTLTPLPDSVTVIVESLTDPPPMTVTGPGIFPVSDALIDPEVSTIVPETEMFFSPKTENLLVDAFRLHVVGDFSVPFKVSFASFENVTVPETAIFVVVKVALMSETLIAPNGVNDTGPVSLPVKLELTAPFFSVTFPLSVTAFPKSLNDFPVTTNDHVVADVTVAVAFRSPNFSNVNVPAMWRSFVERVNEVLEIFKPPKPLRGVTLVLRDPVTENEIAFFASFKVPFIAIAWVKK
jgi:hypothetical protein